MATKIPLWHYEITLVNGDKRECDAIGYRPQEEFLVWDDTLATVLQLRREKVDEVKRSPEPVGEQTVADLADSIPTGRIDHG